MKIQSFTVYIVADEHLSVEDVFNQLTPLARFEHGEAQVEVEDENQSMGADLHVKMATQEED